MGNKVKTCNSCYVEYKLISSFAKEECIEELYCPYCGADVESEEEKNEEYYNPEVDDY